MSIFLSCLLQCTVCNVYLYVHTMHSFVACRGIGYHWSLDWSHQVILRNWLTSSLEISMNYMDCTCKGERERERDSIIHFLLSYTTGHCWESFELTIQNLMNFIWTVCTSLQMYMDVLHMCMYMHVWMALMNFSFRIALKNLMENLNFHNAMQGCTLVVSLLPGNPPWQPDLVWS